MRLTIRSQIKLIVILALGVSLTAILAWVLYGRDYVEQAQFSELRMNLASLETSQQAYFKEYGYYADSFQAVGYAPEGAARALLFINTGDVPKEYLNLLSSEDLPYIEKDRYQILAVFKSSVSHEICFFTKRNNQDLRKVKCVHSS